MLMFCIMYPVHFASAEHSAPHDSAVKEHAAESHRKVCGRLPTPFVQKPAPMSVYPPPGGAGDGEPRFQQ